MLIPERLQLIGYDDIDMAELVHPKLTTVAQPLTELATLASSYMMQLIDGEVQSPIDIQLDNTLVIRQSTKLPEEKKAH